MKTLYITIKTLANPQRLCLVCPFILLASSFVFSQDVFVKTELMPDVNINYFRVDDSGTDQSSTGELYALYGNDFEGSKDFYLTFDLKKRQTVQYEVIDITGRPVGLDEIPDVLDETYKVDLQIGSSGIYIIRLKIDSKYYSEKVYVR